MFYVADRPDCGPDCGPGCHCGKYTELGNDVFMQYEKHHDGHLTPLKQKNVYTGWGLERILAFLNGTRDVYRVDLFAPVIAYIEKVSGTKYEEDEKLTRSMRILADHLRTSVMLIGDEAKLLPSNTGAGYILRRLIRRAQDDPQVGHGVVHQLRRGLDQQEKGTQKDQGEEDRRRCGSADEHAGDEELLAQAGRLSCRKGGKKKKKEEPGTVSFKRMSTRAAFIFKSGCKGKNFKA